MTDDKRLLPVDASDVASMLRQTFRPKVSVMPTRFVQGHARAGRKAHEQAQAEEAPAGKRVPTIGMKG